MSSLTCTQTLPIEEASSSARFLAGMSFPPTIALRPSPWYPPRLASSTYHVGWTPMALNCASTLSTSLTPSGVFVRRAETTPKWKVSPPTMCARSRSLRRAKSFASASGPDAWGVVMDCQPGDLQPAKYSAPGPSKRFSRRPEHLAQAFSAISEVKYDPRALPSSALTDSAFAVPLASSELRTTFKQASSFNTFCSATRRCRSGIRVSDLPFSTRRSKTAMVVPVM
mmetsp:Transcript_88035/g.233728  ORF Transcript_88035/g.233728 Transcript_88035/m.233728 type:complete len:226 (-) Transcript_88035:1629-2306(-)